MTARRTLALALLLILAAPRSAVVIPSPVTSEEDAATVAPSATPGGTGQRPITAPSGVVASSLPQAAPAVPEPIGSVAASPSGEVGTAPYSATATWCAPTPKQCQNWGGGAMLAAVHSFRWGDAPYTVRVWRGELHVDVLVVSYCECGGSDNAIDLSPAAFAVLAPLSRGRIEVAVEVGPALPATDMEGSL